jgi:hypothetical protein
MPPKVGTKGAKKAVTKAKTARAGGDKKRRRRRRESYAIYICFLINISQKGYVFAKLHTRSQNLNYNSLYSTGT